MGKDEPDAPPPDDRVKWIEARIVPMLKSKPETWAKMIATEDYGDQVRRFCNDDSTNRLFFAGGAKEIVCWENVPNNHKKKVVFILKPKDVKLDEKKLNLLPSQVVVGDLNGPLLENLHAALRCVYLPVMTNPKNTVGWPEVVTKRFGDDFHQACAQNNFIHALFPLSLRPQ